MATMARNIALALAAAAVVSGCANSEFTGTDLSANAIAAAEASGLKPPEGGDGGTLHIYTWSDYIAPDVIRGFEQGLGCKVVIDTFDSNEAMYAKLKAGGTGYDIIMPSSYQIETMVAEGMIQKLDHSKIPNVLENFDPSFKDQILDDGFTYNVPYAVTYTGLMYLKDKIPEGADVESWDILANPALKARISILDDPREIIGSALMYLGYSINSTSAEEIDQATEKVLEWRANARKFDAESYKNEVANGSSYLGHGYSTDATQVICGDEDEGMDPRPDIGFALPKEGFTIAFDEMVIAKDASRADLAYAFINYIYDGEVAAANMDYICGPNPVKPGIEALDPEYRDLIVLSPEQLANGQVLRGFADKPEVMALYNKAWDRIKATDSK